MENFTLREALPPQTSRAGSTKPTPPPLIERRIFTIGNDDEGLRGAINKSPEFIAVITFVRSRSHNRWTLEKVDQNIIPELKLDLHNTFSLNTTAILQDSIYEKPEISDNRVSRQWEFLGRVSREIRQMERWLNS